MNPCVIKHAIKRLTLLSACVLAGCRGERDWSAYYSYDPEIRIHLGQLVRSPTDNPPGVSGRAETASGADAARAPTRPRIRPKSILNVGDSISVSDCFIWHERTRINRPGMLSSEGYVYFPKDWGARSGEDSAWGRRNVRAALQLARPEFVTILFGTNDLYQGRMDANVYGENMSAIVDECLDAGAIPILFTIPPAESIAAPRLDEFNLRLEALATLKRIPLVHTDRLFNDHGGWSALSSDGVHPNSLPDGSGGYDLINRVFRQLFQRIELEVLERRTVPATRVALGVTQSAEGLAVETYDRNGDQRADLWRIHQRDGSVIEEYDSDFDGQVDVRWQFELGYLMSGEEDLARDGKFATPFVIADGWKNETP